LWVFFFPPTPFTLHAGHPGIFQPKGPACTRPTFPMVFLFPPTGPSPPKAALVSPFSPSCRAQMVQGVFFSVLLYSLFLVLFMPAAGVVEETNPPPPRGLSPIRPGPPHSPTIRCNTGPLGPSVTHPPQVVTSFLDFPQLLWTLAPSKQTCRSKCPSGLPQWREPPPPPLLPPPCFFTKKFLTASSNPLAASVLLFFSQTPEEYVITHRYNCHFFFLVPYLSAAIFAAIPFDPPFLPFFPRFHFLP